MKIDVLEFIKSHIPNNDYMSKNFNLYQVFDTYSATLRGGVLGRRGNVFLKNPILRKPSIFSFGETPYVYWKDEDIKVQITSRPWTDEELEEHGYTRGEISDFIDLELYVDGEKIYTNNFYADFARKLSEVKNGILTKEANQLEFNF